MLAQNSFGQTITLIHPTATSSPTIIDHQLLGSSKLPQAQEANTARVHPFQPIKRWNSGSETLFISTSLLG
jgi:hypothetical protein